MRHDSCMSHLYDIYRIGIKKRSATKCNTECVLCMTYMSHVSCVTYISHVSCVFCLQQNATQTSARLKGTTSLVAGIIHSISIRGRIKNSLSAWVCVCVCVFFCVFFSLLSVTCAGLKGTTSLVDGVVREMHEAVAVGGVLFHFFVLDLYLTDL